MFLVGLGIGALVGASLTLLVSDKAEARASVEQEPANLSVAELAELRAEVRRLSERIDGLLHRLSLECAEAAELAVEAYRNRKRQKPVDMEPPMPSRG